MKKQKSIDEWEYSNRNWIKVLDEIWKSAPHRYAAGKTGYDENHPLAKRLKIKAQDLESIMIFLDEQGLIKYEYMGINLTEKGFDVAFQNQSAEKTSKINKASLFFSAAIVIFAFANLILGMEVDVYTKWGIIAAILVGIFLFMREIRKL